MDLVYRRALKFSKTFLLFSFLSSNINKSLTGKQFQRLHNPVATKIDFPISDKLQFVVFLFNKDFSTAYFEYG